MRRRTPSRPAAASSLRRPRGHGRAAAVVAGAALAWPAAPSLAGQQAGATIEQVIPGSDVRVTLAYVPQGSFVLGSPPDEPGRSEDEGPAVRVSVTAFWMSTHEVTEEIHRLYRDRRHDGPEGSPAFDVDAVSRPSPPYEDPAHGMALPDHPATGMTQWAALQFVRWLSLKTGRLFRLPTEAEWEYACRAGTTGPRPFHREALSEHAWFAANAAERTHAVGTLAANPWGLHDLLGNVAEWTLDQYDAEAYASLAEGAVDPWRRPTDEHPRSVRGGSFEDGAEALRCAARLESTLRWKRRDPQLPRSRWWNTDSPHVGFRVVSPVEPWTPEEIQSYFDELLACGEPGEGCGEPPLATPAPVSR